MTHLDGFIRIGLKMISYRYVSKIVYKKVMWLLTVFISSLRVEAAGGVHFKFLTCKALYSWIGK